MSFIQIKEVSKEYKKNIGVRDINLSIDKGKFISIVGPFGSGKTTLLRILAGLITDFNGNITIDGRAAVEAKRQHKIGLVFQQPTLLAWRNVIENITLPLEITHRMNEYGRVENLLESIGLCDIANKPIHELSGGMKQLVSIIRSLALDPDILLLDEPFSSIDEMTKDMMHEKLINIHKQSKKTTILVTHSIQEAVYLSDSVVVFSRSPGTVKSIVDIDFKRTSIEDKYSQESLHYINMLRKEIGVA